MCLRIKLIFIILAICGNILAEEFKWTPALIGKVNGEVKPLQAGLTISCSGQDSSRDAGVFAAQKFNENISITAEISDCKQSDAKSIRFGIFLRSDLTENASFVTFAKRPANDWIAAAYKKSAGQRIEEKALFVGNGKKIRFMRLQKNDNKFIASYSPDKLIWFKFFEQEIIMPESSYYGGFFISAPNSAYDAVFSSVEIEKNFSGSPVSFQKIEPSSPALDSFAGIFRFNKAQMVPKDDKNTSGYLDQSPWKRTYYKKDNVIPQLEILGPDGVVYPNFTRAGLASKEFKNFPVVGEISAGDKNFYSTLSDKISRAPASGGTIILKNGVHRLSKPMIINRSNIILRGESVEGAIIEFSYGLQDKQIRWFFPPSGAEKTNVNPMDLIEFHANLDSPENGDKSKMAVAKLKVGDKDVASLRWSETELGRFRVSVTGEQILRQGVALGEHPLTAQVTWKDGSTTESKTIIVLNNDYKQSSSRFGADAAIAFVGIQSPDRFYPPNNMKRGDKSIKKIKGLEVKAGDLLLIHAGPSVEWMNLVRAVPLNSGGASLYREIIAKVADVNNNEIILDKPLRLDFESGKYTFIKKIEAVSNCGVENITIKTVEKIWTHGIYFSNAFNCFLNNVRIEKSGRNNIWTNTVKNIEVKNAEIADAWFKVGGGTAYVGWESATDCLMENVSSKLLRHGPNMQWSANGCVIRNSRFVDSDGQFHAGWPHENLIENCSITSKVGNGSYGYGFFITGPESNIHGPQGPRNVLYNNDISSDMAGIWFGGSNENYLIMHNRINVKRGPAVFLKYGAFDNLFYGNVFSMLEPVPGAVLILTPDCTSNEFINNKFYGVINNPKILKSWIFCGAIPPEVNRDNVFLPYQENPPRPNPAVPSIYEWQLLNEK
jgi:hypothetical protein